MTDSRQEMLLAFWSYLSGYAGYTRSLDELEKLTLDERNNLDRIMKVILAKAKYEQR